MPFMRYPVEPGSLLESPNTDDWFHLKPEDPGVLVQLGFPNFFNVPIIGQKRAVVPAVSFDAGFGGMFPKLPSGWPNPSSEHPEAPLTNIVQPSRGLAGMFRGHFTFDNGTRPNEMGFNNLWEILEDITDPLWVANGGTPTWVRPDFGTSYYTDPMAVAREAQRWLAHFFDLGTLLGTYKCVYVDERIDPDNPTFTFRLTSNVRFKLRAYTLANGGSHNNNGLTTFGWKPMNVFRLTTNATTGGVSPTFIEHPVLHTEEYAIIDTGAPIPQIGSFLEYTHSSNNSLRASIQVIWFYLVDCSYDGVYPYQTTDDAFDNASYDNSRGYPRLRLYGSARLDHLDTGIHDPSHWQEGYNMFTFQDHVIEAETGTPVDPYRTRCGSVYGTDAFTYANWGLLTSANNVSYATTQETGRRIPTFAGFPARLIQANIQDWYTAYAATSGNDLPGATPIECFRPRFGTNGHRYWRIQIVNRANRTNRIRIGYAGLTQSFFFRHNPRQSGWKWGRVRQSELVQSTYKFPYVSRDEATWRAELAVDRAHISEADHWMLQHFFQQPHQMGLLYPHAHQIAPVPAGGSPMPMLMVDPLYMPWEYEARMRDSNIYKDSSAYMGGAPQGDQWPSTRHARGSMFGLAFFNDDPFVSDRASNQFGSTMTIIGSRSGS